MYFEIDGVAVHADVEPGATDDDVIQEVKSSLARIATGDYEVLILD